MGKKRKQYGSQFKVKVALDAIRGEKTIAELASQYELHPTVINNSKRQLLEDASSIFEKDTKTKKEEVDRQSQIDELYRQIGELKVERDFLASRSERLGLKLEKPWSCPLCQPKTGQQLAEIT